MTFSLDQETQPDLESGFRSLELADEGTPEVAASAISSVIHVPAAPLPSAAATKDSREEQPETIAAHPGLSIRRRMFWIDGVGEFRREDGQPTALHAYPPVVRPTKPMEEDQDQAYRGQDLVDPTVILSRHTHQKRRQRQEETGCARAPSCSGHSWCDGARVVQRGSSDRDTAYAMDGRFLSEHGLCHVDHV